MKLLIKTTLLLTILFCILDPTIQDCCQSCISKLTSDTDKQEDAKEDALPSVTTYEVPITKAEDIDADGFCGKIFVKHGTCCNQKELATRAKAWGARLKNRRAKVMNALKKVDRILKHMDKIVEFTKKNADTLIDTEAVEDLNQQKMANMDNMDNKSSHTYKDTIKDMLEKQEKAMADIKKKQTDIDAEIKTLTDEIAGLTEVTDAAKKSKKELELKAKNAQKLTIDTELKAAETKVSELKEKIKNMEEHSGLKGKGEKDLPKGKKGKGKHKKPLKKPSKKHFDGMKSFFGSVIKEEKKEKREKSQKKAKEMSESCHTAMMNLRKNALCLRCSGVATDFYDIETQTYKISKKICINVIKECSAVFATLAETNKLLTELATLKVAKGGEVKKGSQSVMASDGNIDKWTACQEDTDKCVNDDAKVTELCGQFSLSSDNQAIEGNSGAAAEGIASGDSIIDGKDPKDAEADLTALDDDSRRLLLANSHFKSARVLEETTNDDDGYGFIQPVESGGADFEKDFITGESSESSKQLLSIISLFFIILVNFL